MAKAIYPESPGSSTFISGLTSPGVSVSGDTITGTAQSNSTAATYTLELDINGTWTQEATGVSWATLTGGYKVSSVASGTYQARVYTTYLGLQSGYTYGGVTVTPAGLIFSDNFDSTTDFESGTDQSLGSTRNALVTPATGGALPDGGSGPAGSGWDAAYITDDWYPQNGNPNNHSSIEILASNTDKARGGTGKSFVHWRESSADPTQPTVWTCDSQLIKYLAQENNEIYAEFYIAFSPTWYERSGNAGGQVKLFRVGSWNPNAPTRIITANNGAIQIGPMLYWDYKLDSYGLEHVWALRGGPWDDTDGDNDFYQFDDLHVNGPGSMTNAQSQNWKSATAGMGPGGADPQIPDLVNGGYMINYTGTVSHAQIYGPAGTWTKLAFYLKMNSAPGKSDGICTQFINGVQFYTQTNIPWNGAYAVVDNASVFNAGDIITSSSGFYAELKGVSSSNANKLIFRSSAYMGNPSNYNGNCNVGDVLTNGTNTATVTRAPVMVRWNYCAIGGNSLMTAYPLSDKYEDWYAIDDFAVYSGIPV